MWTNDMGSNWDTPPAPSIPENERSDRLAGFVWTGCVCTLHLTAGRRTSFHPQPVGALVYRLGHGPLKAERRVRFPCALPFPYRFQ